MFDKYTIKREDTIESIANNFNTTIDNLIDINNLNINMFREGVEIIVPKNGKNYFNIYTINQGDNLYQIAKKYNINPILLAALNGLNEDDYIYPNQEILVPRSEFSYYITMEGDTLDIVKDKFNTSLEDILNINKTIYLLPGQLIVKVKSNVN